MVFIEYFQKVTKTSNLDVTHKSLTQAREEDLVSAYLPTGPGFNLTNVTSQVVTQSVQFCLPRVFLDQVVAGCHSGYDIWYNRLTKLLRGGEGWGEGDWGRGTG